MVNFNHSKESNFFWQCEKKMISFFCVSFHDARKSLEPFTILRGDVQKS